MSVNEETRQVHEPMSVVGVIRVATLLVSYIVVSSCLIRFNKFLMHKDRFPYAVALAMFHMLVSSVMCWFFYFLSPSSFPGLASTKSKRALVLSRFAPMSMLFVLGLFTSNQAYMYSSVPFLQFMKEANVIIIFLLSLAVGLQVLTRVRAFVIFSIIASSAVAVSGEVQFVWVGFALQLVSQLAECSRIVLGELVLSAKGLKLDPLSYTMFMAPCSLVVLSVGLVHAWDPDIPRAFVEYSYYLLPNGLLAFVLNMLVAATIQETSAVGMALAGVTKDVFLVGFSCLAFGEAVTRRQAAGFAVTLAGVFLWSHLKACPGSAVELALGRLLGDPPAAAAKAAEAPAPAPPTERTPFRPAPKRGEV